MALSIKLSKQPLDLSATTKFVYGNQSGELFVCQAILTNNSERSKIIEFDFKEFENEAFMELTQIAQSNANRFRISKAAIHHRIGSIEPQQPIIHLAFAGKDATMAYQACRRAVEKLQAFFPMWSEEKFEISQVGAAAQAG